jgi:hypothetical protein
MKKVQQSTEKCSKAMQAVSEEGGLACASFAGGSAFTLKSGQIQTFNHH